MRTFILHLYRINLFVAMGAGVLALGWSSFLGLDDALIFSGLITFSVCSVYTAHRIYKCERKLSQAEMNDWYAKNKALVKTTFFISFMMMVIAMGVDIVTGVTGKELLINQFIFDGFMYLTIASFGIASVDKWIVSKRGDKESTETPSDPTLPM